MDFRKAAEQRARSRSPSPIRIPLSVLRSPVKIANINRKSPVRCSITKDVTSKCKTPTPFIHVNNSRHQNIVDENCDPNFVPNYNGNNTKSAHEDAVLAEKDFAVNGDRSYSVITRPRWVLDEEIVQCGICRVEFDIINRKHHCRHCGFIFCGACCGTKYLLPPSFGFSTPQRVCFTCSDKLNDMQEELSHNALHARQNIVELAPNSFKRYLNMPFSMSLTTEIQKATYSTYNLFHRSNMLHDVTIPSELLRKARGIVYVTMMKAGLLYGVSMGTGIIIRKHHPQHCNSNHHQSNNLDDDSDDGGMINDLKNISIRMSKKSNRPNPRHDQTIRSNVSTNNSSSSSQSADYLKSWSAPCAIQAMGCSYGLLIGCEICDYVLFLNSDEAVNVFTQSNAQFTLGAGLDITMGLIGRSGGIELCLNNTSSCMNINTQNSVVSNSLQLASSVHSATASSYSHTRGFYVGAAIESLWFSTRSDVNLQFYGRELTPQELLTPSREQLPPYAAYPLYEALYKVSQEHIEQSGSKILVNNQPPVPPPKAKKVNKRKSTYRRASILI